MTKKAFTILMVCFYLSAAQSADVDESRKCGLPSLLARLKSSGFPVSKSLLPDSEIFEKLAAFSPANILEVKTAVGKLSDREKKISALVDKFPYQIIHRMPIERLPSILKQEALLAPREAKRRDIPLDAPFTPGLEDSLFGGHDCVFVSVGPVKGRDRYGDVIIHVKKDAPLQAWGSLKSGWYFVSSQRNRDPHGEDEATADDRLHFSHNIYTQGDWQQFFKLSLISFLRSKDDSERPQLEETLLNAQSGHEFWKTMDDNRLGYLEGKVAAQLPLSWVEKIEVPASRLQEILNRSESHNWSGIITGY